MIDKNGFYFDTQEYPDHWALAAATQTSRTNNSFIFPEDCRFYSVEAEEEVKNERVTEFQSPIRSSFILGGLCTRKSAYFYMFNMQNVIA